MTSYFTANPMKSIYVYNTWEGISSQSYFRTSTKNIVKLLHIRNSYYSRLFSELFLTTLKMIPLKTNRRVLIWLCGSTPEKGTDWKMKIAHIIFSLTILAINLIALCVSEHIVHTKVYINWFGRMHFGVFANLW